MKTTAALAAGERLPQVGEANAPRPVVVVEELVVVLETREVVVVIELVELVDDERVLQMVLAAHVHDLYAVRKPKVDG